MQQSHPLQNAWTLWYDNKKISAAGAQWEDTLINVQTVSSVEQFWLMLSHARKPSVVELGANYHFFKKGVKPMWEDPANKEGGKWVIALTSKEDLFRLDEHWQEVLMSLVGEYIDDGVDGELVTGCVLAKRRNLAKISIWVRSHKDQDLVMGLGKRIRQVMPIVDPQVSVDYFPHNLAPQDPPMLKA